QDGTRSNRIGKDRVLRDLELEAARVDAPPLEQLRDLVRQVQVEQVAARDVDRDPDLEPGVLPGAALPERAVQDVARERADEAAVLGEWDELVRRQQPVLGVDPANERLDAADLACLEVRLRLVVDDELAVQECPSEL